MIDVKELLGEMVRIKSMTGSDDVLAEGRLVSWTDQPTVTVATNCECGRPITRSHRADLPMDVACWIDRQHADPSLLSRTQGEAE